MRFEFYFSLIFQYWLLVLGYVDNLCDNLYHFAVYNKGCRYGEHWNAKNVYSDILTNTKFRYYTLSANHQGY